MWKAKGMALGCLTGAYRATPNESTGMTPHLFTIGREVRVPAELVFGSTNTSVEITSYDGCVDSLRARIQYAHEIARKYMSTVAKRSRDLYDSKVAFHRYNVSEVVWCLMEARKVGISPKLERVFKDPLLVHKKLSEINYVLQLDKAGMEWPVHQNKLIHMGTLIHQYGW